VGPRAGLDAVEKKKIVHCRESNPGPTVAVMKNKFWEELIAYFL
jgi:hypothetical protein